MRVIVAGGGIAGMATAIALKRLGMEVEVHEAMTQEDAPDGLFLSLASNGVNALHDLGLPDLLTTIDVVPTPWMTFQTSKGRNLARVPLGLAQGPEPVTVLRKSLYAAVTRAALSQGILLRHGSKVSGFQRSAKGVMVQFADGSEAEAGLLIGADGINSKVRNALPGNTVAPKYSGLVNLGGIVPATGLSATTGSMQMVWGYEAFFGYTVREGGEAWWFANVAVAEQDLGGSIWRASTETIRPLLLESFSRDDPTLSRLIAATAQLRGFPIFDLAHVPCWHDGAVVLVGDAAHATSPSSGQGAALALEDAVCLGALLAHDRNPETALPRFVAHRRARAERIVAEGQRRGRYKAPRFAVQRALRDLIVPFMLKRFVTAKSMEWIYGYRAGQGL
jgi:FAD-dependent urate hydroxylase